MFYFVDINTVVPAYPLESAVKIASSDISLASSHALTTQQSIKESLRAWIGDNRPNFDGVQAETKAAQTASPANTVQISDAGKNASEADAIQASDDAAENDPRVQLIKSLIEFLLGKKIKLFHASDMHAPSNSTQAKCQSSAATSDQTPATPASSKKAGWGVEYNYHESIT
jgi:hypothetical protein